MDLIAFLNGYRKMDEGWEYENFDWHDWLTAAWDGTPEEMTKFLNENR